QARVQEQLSREPAPERLASTAKLLAALGLLEQGADLRGLLLQFRSGLVLGQYDPETKQLYVVTAATVLGPMERATAAHEYTHALQDQHFDLLALRPRHSTDGDRNLAVTALLEADAVLVTERYVATHLTPTEREQRRQQLRALQRDVDLDRFPLVVREQSYFPYTEGPRFLRQVLGEETLRGDAYGPAVDRLFADPPQATAQILHPERYVRRVAPLPVALPELAPALGDEWRLTREGVLGELEHRLALQHYLEPSTASRAAEGWAGARYALLESTQEQLALVVRTRWDHPAEADEWLAAYRAVVQRRFGPIAPREEQMEGAVAAQLWSTPDGALLLARQGADTLLVRAPAANQARTLAVLALGEAPTVRLPVPAAPLGS
ncbi:MAG: hypothetical protein IRZ14_19325, partial [Chloroflexi bacterium]|nr:hypothetical protein [Chloroflexota bacterium]